MGFPVRIVGGTDPDRSRGGAFAAIVFAADGTGDKAGKQGEFPWLGRCVFLLPPPDLVLNSLKGFRRDNGFVGIRCMILGQFSLILPGDFGQMVLTKFGLEKEISGIGVVAQDSVHGTLVKDAATLGGIPFLVESLDNGGSSFPSR